MPTGRRSSCGACGGAARYLPALHVFFDATILTRLNGLLDAVAHDGRSSSEPPGTVPPSLHWVDATWSTSGLPQPLEEAVANPCRNRADRQSRDHHRGGPARRRQPAGLANPRERCRYPETVIWSTDKRRCGFARLAVEDRDQKDSGIGVPYKSPSRGNKQLTLASS
jgi:hypothetical protein